MELTEKENKELIKFVLEDASEEQVDFYLNEYPGFPYHIGDNWHLVMTDKEKKYVFGDSRGVDLPSLKYYNDEILSEPYHCKEFKGKKYIFFVNDDTRNMRMFY